MKTIYFVRHGESENNATHKYNSIDTPLSKRGEQQAEIIAERCSKLSAEIIIASDMLRAQQTAKTIASRTGLSIETNKCFRERVSATSILGKSRDDVEAAAAMKMIEENFHVPEWRYEDGENFEGLKQRALEGLDHVAQRPESNIIVVSHGYFMYVVVAAVMFGRDLTSHECKHVIESLGELENTALTVVKHRRTSTSESRSPWRLIVWNDHAHLG